MLKLTNKKLGGNMKEKFKSIWDNTTAKIIIFVATSIIIPATVQFIGENLLNFKFLEGHPTLAFVFYCAVFILLTLFIVSVIKLIKFLFVKKDLFEDTNNKIESVCSKYQYKSNFIADKEIKSELKKMYYLPDSNLNNLISNTKYTNKDGKQKAKSNIIYYGFSAKKYLNWIDFVYLNFLRKLKETLGCKIIIALHFPDYIKECKIDDTNDTDPNSFVNEFNNVVKYFSSQIKKIIGNDVIIKTENQFYRENVKKYAEDFHSVYVAYSLFYASKIGTIVDGKEFMYKDYKRKLSHIESSFPIWMMSSKSNRDRFYVLDNRFSNQIWDIEPLKSIRKANDIYFIEVTDLNNEQGQRLNVHKEGNCINLTDSELEIDRKIKLIDSVYEKKMMLRLLDEGFLSTSHYYEPHEETLDIELKNTINELIKKYNILKAEDELITFNLYK